MQTLISPQRKEKRKETIDLKFHILEQICIHVLIKSSKANELQLLQCFYLQDHGSDAQELILEVEVI